MFVEPSNAKLGIENGSGWIEVICGSMFSGKTEELIRRLKRAYIAQQKVEIFKPKLDRRYSKKHIVSHDESKINSEPVNYSTDVLLKASYCDVVGLDEAQFFDQDIVDVCNKLANQGKRVIVAGLDMDFKGRPFSPMDQIMAIAEYITKVHAICMNCGNVASYSHRRTSSEKKVVLGEKDIYEALCRKCFYEKMHR
jgi:thymidine kinase